MNPRRVNAAAAVVLAAMQTRQTAAGIAVALESACLLQSPESAAEMAKLRSDLEEMTRCRDNALRALYRDDVETDVDLEETIAAPFYGPGWDWDEADLMRVVREAVAAIRPAFAKLAEECDGLRAERHSTNEALSDAAEQLRVQRDRIAELEAAAAKVAVRQYRDQHGDIWEERADGECLQNVRLVNAEAPHENGWYEAAETVIRDFGPMTPLPVSEPVARLRTLLHPSEDSPVPPPRQVENPHDSPLHHDYALGRDLPEVTP